MYRKTQIGTVVLVFLGLGFVVSTVAAVASGWHPAALAAMGFLILLMVLFGSLTVTVDSRALRCAFGPGLIHRTIPLERIASARAVNTRWFFGWGIRYTPTGWLWNVSGLQAVELDYRDGGRFLVGSPEPETLVAAIERAAGRAS